MRRANGMRRKDLWWELIGVAPTFQGALLQKGRDFNFTLEAKYRPNDSRFGGFLGVHI